MFCWTRVCAATLLAAGGAGVSALAVPDSAPNGEQPRIIRVASLPDIPLGQFQQALLPGTVPNDRRIRLGSIGSDLFRLQGDPGNEFWMVTDRGPNGQPGGRRTFPVPEFNPTIAHVRVSGDRIELLDALSIHNPDGSPVSGMSNVIGFDETPWNFNATGTLPGNPNGLDTEGIVRTPDGDFWLVDEYSPSLLHVSANGTVLKRVVPVNSPLTCTGYPVTKSLPQIFNARRQNRGFEALALSPDGATLFIGLQSPLENPNRTIGRASRNTRILRFDIASQAVTGEFVYRLDEVCAFTGQPAGCGAAPGDMKLSSMTALSDSQLLVDERTDDIAKIVLVDLSKASDIYMSQWDQLATSPSLEAYADPATAGVAVLSTQLVVNLSTLPGMPKKIEGVTLVTPEVLAVANDNDFGLVDETTFDSSGNLSNDTGVVSQILYVKLARPLPH